MYEIRIPRINSNDTEYVVAEWLKGEGSLVRAGDPLVIIETSKTLEELAAEHSGILKQAITEGATCSVGALIGLQFDTLAARDAFCKEQRTVHGGPARADGSGFMLTEAARQLVEKNHISAEALTGLGRKVIRGRDVDLLITGKDTTAGSRAGRRAQQNAVAAVVERSHREIPAAFTVMRIYIDSARELECAISEQQGFAVGLAEMFVRALGLLDSTFPAFYRRADPEDGRRKNIGITIDVGTGLFIPVVPAAGERSLHEIAILLAGLRKKAMRRTISRQDLLGSGDIVLSLSNEIDIVFAETIVFPGHACMLSVGGIFDELALNSGEIFKRSYVNAGLAYDHRIVNGRDAVFFLRAVKILIEDPASLVGIRPDGEAT